MTSAHVLSGLMKWLGHEDWQGPFNELTELHLGDACAEAGITLEDLGEAIDEHHASVLWGCVFEDFLAAELDDGRNIVDDYLKRRGWRESLANKRYLASLRSSVMSLYEVSNIVRDESFMARDLVRGGEPVRVSEKTATHYLKKWDRIAGRIVAVGAKMEMSGGALPFSHELGETLLGTLAELKITLGSELALNTPSARSAEIDDAGVWTHALRHSASVFTTVWLTDLLERTLHPNLPKMCNSDGDEIVFTTVRYPLRADADREALENALNAVRGFHRESETGWNWAERPVRGKSKRDKNARTRIAGFGDGSISMANVELTADSLVLETNSPQRAEKARALMQPAICRYVGEPVIDLNTVEQSIQSQPSRGRAERSSGIPPEEERAIIQESLERHYRGLLTQRIPALGNITPRNAARTEKGRAKLADWLKYMENGCAHHSPESPMAGYDIGWMWEELGISDLRR